MSLNKQLLTVVQAAKALGITRAAVYKRINKGQLAIEKIGGRLFVPMTAIASGVETENKIADLDKGVAKVIREYAQTIKMLGLE